MKAFIASLTLIMGANAYAIGDCAAKVKLFSETFASEHIDIVPDGKNTSVEFAPDGKSAKVELVNSNGTRIRQLSVKMGAGTCSIIGVESLDSELN